jgi:hypothetical protein
MVHKLRVRDSEIQALWKGVGGASIKWKNKRRFLAGFWLALRVLAGKSAAAVANAVSDNKTRDFFTVLAVWALLAVPLLFLAQPNTSVPGLYYDEAHCAAMARDFLTGRPHLHMPGSGFISVCGRPFPVFVQLYGGAAKSWLLLPSFALFGASMPVLRLTALGWGLAALLLFMLWTWRWLGRNTALLAGALLAFDPAFFFISVLDWGPALPSFLCRFTCFYFTLRWWQTRNQPQAPEPKDSGGEMTPEKLSGASPAPFFRRVSFAAFRAGWRAFLAGLFAGLGFYNKIDFAVLLGGVLLALLCANARPLWARRSLRRSSIRHFRSSAPEPPFSIFAPPLVLAGLGFLLTAGPMLIQIPGILNALSAGGSSATAPGELAEKLNTTLAMYDGSYFYRLMDAGGLFDKMYQSRAPVFAPLGIALILAAFYLVLRSVKDTVWQASHPPGNQREQRRSGGKTGKGSSAGNPRPLLFRVLSFFGGTAGDAAAFPILAVVFITVGIFLMPGAVRIHHFVLVYPFPHLVVAMAVERLWRQRRLETPGSPVRNVFSPSSAVVAALFILLLASQLFALQRTQQLIRQTGGRGRWSDALSAFARQVKDRSDLTIVSLDWGFNEQLAFLTDGPALAEPFWEFLEGNTPPALRSTNCIYLAYPAEYSLYPFGPAYLEEARRAAPGAVEIQPWNDHQGRIAFYSIRWRGQ